MKQVELSRFTITLFIKLRVISGRLDVVPFGSSTKFYEMI